MLITLSLLLFQLHARQAVFDQPFQSSSSSLVTIASTQPKKPVLVLYWANWCAPCKAEMKMVSQTDVKNLEIVAINVDEEEDWESAASLLKQVQWKHRSLRDVGGAFFYTFRPSGELPYGQWLDAGGNLIELITHLSQKKLLELDKKSLDYKTKKTGASWQTFQELKYRSSNTSKKQTAGTSLGVKLRTEHWDAGTTYRLLGQELQQEAELEDEIGEVYVEYRGTEWSVRLGDDYVNWLGGRLLNVRRIYGTEEDFSLLGLHFLYFTESQSLEFIGGKIRNSLYGTEIDPTKDASVNDLPNQQAFGAKYSRRFPGLINDDLRVTFAAVDYLREKDIDLGYLDEHHDQRYGLSLSDEGESHGYKVSYSEFRLQSEPSEKSFFQPYIGQANLWSSAGILRLPVIFLQYRSLPWRALSPTLIDQPGTPIATDDAWSTSFAPKVTVDDWQIELPTVYEESLTEGTTLRQVSHSLNLTHPVREFKSTLMGQNKETRDAGTQTESTELFLVVGGYLTKSLSAQYTEKAYEEKSSSTDSSGRSSQLALAYNLDLAPRLRTTLWYTGTLQTDYYKGFTQLDKGSLNAFAVSVNWNKLQSKLTVGQEPGGFVCANGICAIRPAVDGVKLDFNYSQDF